MRLVRCALAVIAVVALTGAARAPKAPPPAPLTPMIAPGEQSRIIGFDRVELRMQVGSLYATIRCERDGNPFDRREVTLQSGTTLNSPDFAPTFNRAVEAAGYRTSQSASSLFKSEDRGTDAQLIVAGAVTEVSINACNPPPDTILVQRNGKASVAVDWEVYDPVERRVILKTSTRGQGSVEKPPGNPALAALVAAFANAGDALVRLPEFHRLATLPAAPQQAPQAAAPVGAGTATTIARLPLSTTAFQQQTDKVIGQVATVLLGQAFGSGFYISDTLLLTNQHVVGLSQYVKVRLHSGKEMIGEVLSRDAGRDVALVKTDSVGVPGLPLHVEEPGIGSQVYVIGTPIEQGLAQTVSSGIVSGFRVQDRHRFLQSEANTQHGSSGGPMVDDKGNVVAMVEGGLEANDVARGINFFIPIGEALKTLNVTFAGG